MTFPLKLKHLESFLSQLDQFPSPDPLLEQYPTLPHMVSKIFFHGVKIQDILEKTVLDLGCGPGNLGIACLLLGAESCLFVDADIEILEICRQNCIKLNILSRASFFASFVPIPSLSPLFRFPDSFVENLQQFPIFSFSDCKSSKNTKQPAQISKGNKKGSPITPAYNKKTRMSNFRLLNLNYQPNSIAKATIIDSKVPKPLFDVVIMNPPFGVRTPGADITFLQQGLALGKIIYSMHKSSTRAFIAKKSLSFKCSGKRFVKKATVIGEMLFDLPKTMKFHKMKDAEVEVDFWKFQR